MEDVAAAPCRNEAAVCRFYRRLGGLIAAAHLLKAVDCHRDNLIAAEEQPVLVDVDALWHVSPLAEAQSAAHLLYRTGFFPNTKRRSLQSRSSILGPAKTGKHLPRLRGAPVAATRYQPEVARGFSNAWRCLVGTKRRRASFARRVRRILTAERRWIYWATEKYAAIREAAFQPGVLRSGAEQDRLIRRLCARDDVPASVIDAEIRALKALDIPYFVARPEAFRPEQSSVPASDPGDEIVQQRGLYSAHTVQQYSSASDAERWRNLLAVRRGKLS
jgi:lantibiotic modifying enzyme